MMRGDRVRKKNGDTFSNRKLVLTVDRLVEETDTDWKDEGMKVYFQETGTWAHESYLEIVSRTIKAVEL